MPRPITACDLCRRQGADNVLLRMARKKISEAENGVRAFLARLIETKDSARGVFASINIPGGDKPAMEKTTN